MLPELESVLNEIHGYYSQGLIKRYPPDPDTKKECPCAGGAKRPHPGGK